MNSMRETSSSENEYFFDLFQRLIVPAFLIALVTLAPQFTFAQKKKLDLDDLMIKGELHSDDRILMLARERNEMKQSLRYRKDYRKELMQETDEFRKTKNRRKF